MIKRWQDKAAIRRQLLKNLLKIQVLDIHTFEYNFAEAHDFLKDYEVKDYVNCMVGRRLPRPVRRRGTYEGLNEMGGYRGVTQRQAL